MKGSIPKLQPPGSSSNLATIAHRLENDLRSRNLRAGDRYLTIADAALMLGVSKATVQRAMGILVQRKLLTRQQGQGTFVGIGIGENGTACVRAAREQHRFVGTVELREPGN